jgi:farnesyl diphosphate synthase
MQALFLVADDIMDGSQTRRGQPCWYRVPEVKLDAINDTLILESFMWFLINKYFRGSRQHVPLLELFQSVSYQTQMGQMLDLTSQPQGAKNPQVLAGFSLEVYNRIVTFKTAIYTFYLPIAAAMTLQGYTSRSQLDAARQISIELGKKFQIEDDYLDCYGDPAKIGKDGTVSCT